MAGKIIKILIIGEDFSHALNREELAKNLNPVFRNIDHTEFLEIASKNLPDFTYEYYLVGDKRMNQQMMLEQLKDMVIKDHRCHDFPDQLTDLISRSCFLNQIKALSSQQHLPLSFIVGDINDLRLINDIFGYNKGDDIIKKIAEIFNKHCPASSIITRWGGDEFAAALPETTGRLSLEIAREIKQKCGEIDSVPIKISISLGTATKEKANQNIEEFLKKAEAEMSRAKMMEAKNVRNSTIASLVKLLGEKSYETEAHAWRMQALAVRFGSELSLTDNQLEDLILTVTLHDIGKLAIPEHILEKPGNLTPEEKAILKEHSTRGYRIVLSSNELAHTAPAILSHHERWDGTGYPRGLKGKEIPLLSRLIAIVDSYDVMTNGRPYKKAMTKQEALQELRYNAGKQFDPDLVDIFLRLNLE